MDIQRSQPWRVDQACRENLTVGHDDHRIGTDLANAGLRGPVLDPLRLEDLETARGLFAERGIPHHPPIDWGDHDCVYFLDPDGNLLEIVAYKRPSV